LRELTKRAKFSIRSEDVAAVVTSMSRLSSRDEARVVCSNRGRFQLPEPSIVSRGPGNSFRKMAPALAGAHDD
jgi:hypothetical protein